MKTLFTFLVSFISTTCVFHRHLKTMLDEEYVSTTFIDM